MLKSKIHRATVTDANLNYEGSITVDEALMEAAHMVEYEQVEIYDIDNGSRFSTYVIKGKRNGGDICLNGAAARLVERGDLVIICSYSVFEESEASVHVPWLVYVDENNRIKNLNVANG